jgi:hypothetical protein
MFTQIDDTDGLNHPISPIPTLEDLKRVLFEPVYPELEFGYPSKVTGVEDIKSAAFLPKQPLEHFVLHLGIHYNLDNNE